MTTSDHWAAEAAERYDETSKHMYDPNVLDPAVDLLASLADGNPALEFAVGTGRVAIPLADRGVDVTGIDFSQPMLDELLKKRDDITVLLGDMATTKAPGKFALVYAVWNCLGNLLTQAEQVACFRNAAHHLLPGGYFVIELWIPAIRRMPPGQAAVPFHLDQSHLGFDTYDMSTQRGTSHHYWPQPDGTAEWADGNFRYVWPSECDLMAELAGMRLDRRMADWRGAPFIHDSENHVSVWQKPV